MKLSNMRTLLFGAIPLIFFVGLLAVFLKSLTPIDNQQILNIPFPAFVLSDLHSEKLITHEQLKGKAAVIHVWASWCGACIKEHEEWLTIKKNWPLLLVSVIYRDNPVRVVNFLKEKGDPYDYVLNDLIGKLGLDLGIIGTPETFVVDPNGIIRYHKIGVIDEEIFKKEVVPLINKFTLAE